MRPSPLDTCLEMACITDIGRMRRRNEDVVHADAGRGIALLADGMGGYAGGDLAARMAVEGLAAGLARRLATAKPHALDASGQPNALTGLEEEIGRTNLDIYRAACAQPAYRGMGTTLVATWFYNDSATVAHVGDSRCYRFRHGVLQLLTRDHSVLQEQLDRGMIGLEEMASQIRRGIVTRAVGVMPRVDVDVRTFDCLPGDLFLLVSDGLTDMVQDDVLFRRLIAGWDSLERLVADLVALANEQGGHDNISVVAVAVRAPFPARVRGRFGGWW